MCHFKELTNHQEEILLKKPTRYGERKRTKYTAADLGPAELTNVRSYILKCNCLEDHEKIIYQKWY